jgi:hypothetical protein
MLSVVHFPPFLVQLGIRPWMLLLAVLLYLTFAILLSKRLRKTNGKATARTFLSGVLIMPLAFVPFFLNWGILLNQGTEAFEKNDNKEQAIIVQGCPDDPRSQNIIDSLVSINELRIKKGVDLSSLCYPVAFQLPTITKVFRGITGEVPVVTSGKEGMHAESSAHYNGMAIDMRINNTTGEQQEYLAVELQKYLSSRWVVLYGDDTHLDHIHLEFRQ